MIFNSKTLYDHAYEVNNVYGHALDLLSEFSERVVDIASNGVHLDLGCGFGRIAEPLTERLGLHYIGVDGDDRGLISLQERGFEAHKVVFGTAEQLVQDIEQILNGRRLYSLTMLDTLEHLPNGTDVLNAIRALISRNSCPAVISVPNVAHRDVGFRLAMGEWDYTEDGLLDHTHTHLFTQRGLEQFLQHSGLQTVARNPVRISLSDQAFPVGHPAVSAGSQLHQLLSHIRNGVDDTASINQFVQLVQAGPRSAPEPFSLAKIEDAERPFLSIITRTQGKRILGLEEVILALTAQEDTDFELIVVGHKLEYENQKAIERVIEDAVEGMRNRIRLVLVDDGNRTRPLNVGFAEARGQYIVILDDDDLPLAHWTATFRELARKKPGAVLRSVAAKQTVTSAKRGKAGAGIKAIGGFEPYPAHFDLFTHLSYNETPPISFAVPRSLFQDLGIRFDETLTTTEDWDFLIRCALLVGVATSSEITCIYRWWSDNDHSSRTDHNNEEWLLNHEVILKKFDQLPILLPPGSSRRIRHLMGMNYSPPPADEAQDRRLALLKSISEVLNSWSWRLTKPLRLPARLRGRKDPKFRKCFDMPESQLIFIEGKLRKSGSWRKTKIFRKKRK
ncbi:methyltransferase domain-containing protein [Martelella limonii]|uniref:methyltransferase domain-containing protein n=1 Tax=Martelella limonii TaxID=1647649 RepID=UPI00157FC4E8|nr:methyltransferase domain-containing protein [Martelella limonii]